MKVKLLYVVLLLIVISCKQSNITSQSLEGKILTSKTILFEQQIDGNMISRPVIIETSADSNNQKSYPIVIALHGRGGSNTNWVQPLSKFTNSGEFIGVYPQGYLNSWNLGQEPSNANDAAFISNIIDTLLSYSNVEENKIFAVGNSNGSGMVNVLGGVNKRLKAIAPIASQLTERTEININAIPLSVFQVNGDQDLLIPIDGGMKLGHPFLSASDSAKKWAANFNCNQNITVEETGQTVLHTYSDCDDSVVVKYLIVKGAGHNIASYYSSLWNEVWDFFSSLD
jgi:poly(3-hydroxybutyrate) depolymerase